MTRVFLIGKNGQIGWELNRTLQNVGDVIAVGKHEVDITDRDAVHSIIREIKPNIIINATGYNDVDGAEKNEQLAFSLNKDGVSFLTDEAAKNRACFISYSSDYVFDGQKNNPYTEADIVNPINVYGKSKLAGEQTIQQSSANYLIIRTSSVFSNRRPCFLTKFLEWAKTEKQLKIVTNLTNSPTSARYLAEITALIIAMGGKDCLEWLSERKGLYHLAGAGYASRFEWARTIREILDLKVKIVPTPMPDFPSLAKRPTFSALDTSKFVDVFHVRPPSWKQMLKTTLDELL